jgi:hypothetical protein
MNVEPNRKILQKSKELVGMPNRQDLVSVHLQNPHGNHNVEMGRRVLGPHALPQRDDCIEIKLAAEIEQEPAVAEEPVGTWISARTHVPVQCWVDVSNSLFQKLELVVELDINKIVPHSLHHRRKAPKRRQFVLHD